MTQEQIINKVKCPFCSELEDIRGSGCCYCDHSGLISFGKGKIFHTEAEALNHDPGISSFDLEINRKLGKYLKII